MKHWITALLLAACTSLHAQGPTPAAAGHVAFTVKRGDCASPDELDLDHWKEVKSQWRSDGALEVTLWDTETQEYSVIDDSASLDTSAPGTPRLFYRVKRTTLPTDSPVVFCEDWVKLTFVIPGVARAPYRVTVETTQLVREGDIEG